MNWTREGDATAITSKELKKAQPLLRAYNRVNLAAGVESHAPAKWNASGSLNVPDLVALGKIDWTIGVKSKSKISPNIRCQIIRRLSEVR
jgi:hypothetical protein